MEEEEQPSIKDKWDKKKYTGDPRVVLALIVVMMSRLPAKVTK